MQYGRGILKCILPFPVKITFEKVQYHPLNQERPCVGRSKTDLDARSTIPHTVYVLEKIMTSVADSVYILSHGSYYEYF